MDNLKSFSVADGHIESILIGAHDAKIAFQRWDCKQFNLIFCSCFSVINNDGVYRDIGEVRIDLLKKGVSCRYDQILRSYSETDLYLVSFIDSWNELGTVVELVAAAVDIILCGEASDINTALFAIDNKEYMGNQPCQTTGKGYL